MLIQVVVAGGSSRPVASRRTSRREATGSEEPPVTTIPVFYIDQILLKGFAVFLRVLDLVEDGEV